jgi:hypothetical protein
VCGCDERLKTKTEGATHFVGIHRLSVDTGVGGKKIWSKKWKPVCFADLPGTGPYKTSTSAHTRVCGEGEGRVEAKEKNATSYRRN